MGLDFSIEIEREDDGRWIAEIPGLPGVMACGATEQAAIAAEAMALWLSGEGRGSNPPFLLVR